MYQGIEENEVAHKIDENINYYSCEQQGYGACWMFRSGELSNRSVAMKDFNDIEREIGTGILREIRHRAIDEITLDYIRYCVVPVDEVIDVYDTYEHKEQEQENEIVQSQTYLNECFETEVEEYGNDEYDELEI